MEKSPDDIVAEYKKRRLRQLLISSPVIVWVIGVSAGRVGAFGMSEDILFLLGIPLVMVVLPLSFVNWRCPSCSGYLGRNVLFLRACRKCGAKFRS